MSTADIYKQYLSDYEDAAKRYNAQGKAYQNSLQLSGGPANVRDSNTGQMYGLYWTPQQRERQIVQNGTEQDYYNARQNQDNLSDFAPGENGTGTWTRREGQNPNAMHAFGTIGGPSGYYADLGNGVAALRTGGRPTGNIITERIEGDQRQADEMAASGNYRDVRFNPGSGEVVGHTIGNGDMPGDAVYAPGSIDVSYEELAFADKPGDFRKQKPSLTQAQIREMQNPTPTASDEVRGEDIGLINGVRLKEQKAGAGLISSER